MEKFDKGRITYPKAKLIMYPTPELLQFLSLYDQTIQALTLQLRSFIIETLPSTNELIWDNYNALAIAYSKSNQLKDAFCHFSVYSKHVNFGFNRGSELSNVLVPLKGNGKLIRHISVVDWEAFPKKEIQAMLLEAIEISENNNESLLKPTLSSKSIVMSISKKKRRPNL